MYYFRLLFGIWFVRGKTELLGINWADIFRGLMLLLSLSEQRQWPVSYLLCAAAFCPFHIGNFAVTGLQAQDLVSELKTVFIVESYCS